MDKKVQKIIELYEISGKKDICIVGKGGSINKVNLDNLENYFVINLNDSEDIYAGQLGVFYHDWVRDSLSEKSAKCDLYLTNKELKGIGNYLTADRVTANPENLVPIQERFFDRNLVIEDSVLITALKISNLIADGLRKRLSVYLLGFDFSLKTGFSHRLASQNLHDEESYVESLLSAQEVYLQFILEHGKNLSVDVLHVGNKSYSKLLPEEFNGAATNKSSNFQCNETVSSLEDISEMHPVNRVKVVAEITTNHFGDLQLLKKMIKAAKIAGADYIKLQKRDVESFYFEEELSKPYTSPFGNTFRDYRHGLELDEFGFNMVEKWCKELGIGWFVSVLDQPSYEFMKQFSPKMIKLPSTISEHKGFLDLVASDYKQDVVISTGMTDKDYEEFILNTFVNCQNLYLLQCTSSYPTKNADANVGVVRHYHDLSKQYPKIKAGYSSHDIGSLCCMLAVASGAEMIEKHVKYGNTPWAHFDNVAIDMLTDNFKSFVQDIRMAEVCMGSEVKEVQDSEHHKYFKKSC